MAKKQARGKPYSFLPVECVRRLRPSVFVLIALRMLGPLQARIPLAANIASFPVLLPMLVTVSSVSSQREVAKPAQLSRDQHMALTSSHFQRHTARHPSSALIGSSVSF